jgi:hypothetical protein
MFRPLLAYTRDDAAPASPGIPGAGPVSLDEAVFSNCFAALPNLCMDKLPQRKNG